MTSTFDLGGKRVWVAGERGMVGALLFDASTPDGTPRKLADTARLNALGWHPAMPLAQGIAAVYRWVVDTHGAASAYRAAA